MSEWTQEQRQAAVNQWDAMMPNFTSYHNMGIELACQRNELTEALEDLLDAIPKQTNDADWWPDELTHAVRAARAAIAKAEVSQ